MKNDKLKVAVLGWGKEGKSAAPFLHKRLGNYAEISILDEGKVPVVNRDKRFSFVVGKKFSGLGRFDLIVRSPGIPYLSKSIQAAIKAGVAVTSVTNIFLQEILAARGKAKYPKIIAITGTKGKGSTSTMLFEILRKAKKSVVLAGNIGTPLLDVLGRAKGAEYIVLELSSFQLQDIKHSVDVAVLLSISKDHMDHHMTMKEYVDAKLELFRKQVKGSRTYAVSSCAKYLKGKKWLNSKLAIVSGKDVKLFDPENLKVIGQHNVENAAVAARVAKDLGISKPAIRYAVENFKGLPNRIEFIAKKGKVSFYNDSFSTIPSSTVAAIKSFSEPVILIMGGRQKIDDYSSVKSALKKSSVEWVVLMGENAKKLNAEFRGLRARPILGGKSLGAAVSRAYTLAKNINRDAVVLFSPGTASFDMFKNASERGEKFKNLVLKLPKS